MMVHGFFSHIFQLLQRYMDYKNVVSLLKQLISQEVPRILLVFQSCITTEESARHVPSRDESVADIKEDDHEDNNNLQFKTSPTIIYLT